MTLGLISPISTDPALFSSKPDWNIAWNTGLLADNINLGRVLLQSIFPPLKLSFGVLNAIISLLNQKNLNGNKGIESLKEPFPYGSRILCHRN